MSDGNLGVVEDSQRHKAMASHVLINGWDQDIMTPCIPRSMRNFLSIEARTPSSTLLYDGGASQPENSSGDDPNYPMLVRCMPTDECFNLPSQCDTTAQQLQIISSIPINV
jgi:hypothetical protein